MNKEFKINGKVLETERLILRPFNEGDLDDLFEYASVPDVGERAGWSHHKDKEESKIILNMFINEDKVFAIVNKKNNKVIGSIGVEQYNESDFDEKINKLNGREIGYVLSKNYWGLGIMPEATKCVIDYLFNEIDLDFLTCLYFNFNNQSKRVQEKLGFKFHSNVIRETRMGTKEPSILNILMNPNEK